MGLDGKLISLIRDAKNEEAKSLIEEFNFYKEVDICGYTLLHYAAMYANLKMVRYLLAKGCDVDAQNMLGHTPLMEALRCQNEKVAIILIEANADLFKLNKENKNSLHFLFALSQPSLSLVKRCLIIYNKQCRSSAQESARQLINFGCRLHHALFTANADIIESMIQQGSPIVYEHRDFMVQQSTIIHSAVIINEPKIVSVLLKYGVDANVCNTVGKCPMNILYSNTKLNIHKQTKILQVLLDAGAEPMLICPKTGVFQCSSILRDGPREALSLLLKSSKLDFNTRDSHGRTALHSLAFNRSFGIADELKVQGIKFNLSVTDERNKNALHYAGWYANAPILKFFLEQTEAEIDSVKGSLLSPAILFGAYNNSKTSVYQGDQCIEMLLQHNTNFQFLIRMGPKRMTILDFDIAEKNNNRIDRLKPIVAQIALQHKLGMPIIDLIHSNINSQPSFKVYFEQCREMLDKKVVGNVKILDLLAANKKKMAKYLNNKKLVNKLIRLSRNQAVTSMFSYYSSTLRKHYSKAITYKFMKNKAAEVISKFSEGRLTKGSIVMDRLIDIYLTYQDLKKLCQL